MQTIHEAITEMLTENTGIIMCDSGGVNGRLWQQNKDKVVDDFQKEPTTTTEITDVDDIIVSYNVFHYLTNFLEVTETSDALNNILQLDAMDYDGMELMEQFLSHEIIDTSGYECHGIVNTYNRDSIISAVLQYGIFEYETEYSYDTYIILQIHTGADARVGYTEPRIFRIDDIDYFTMAQFRTDAFCECDAADSDDCGYTYQSNEYDTIDWRYDSETKQIVCNRCNKPVEFGVMESY